LAAWGISIVNGIVGDYLRDRRNGLAIDMAFYHQRQPLALTRQSLQQAHPYATAKICILIHGLGCHEGIWMFRDPAQPGRDISYGTLLQTDLGYTPFYVRYNTGLSLAANGQSLATLLDGLATGYPAQLADVVLIGHSMGGLIIRSACYYGAQRQAAWTKSIRRVFYLGTPHGGAPLAKLGHLATTVLHAVPNPITHLIGDILDQRSQGVKDLRFGTLLEADATSPPGRQDVPWLASARHYLIVGTLTTNPQAVASIILGDGLARVPRTQTADLPISPDHVRLFPGMRHMQLARDLKVYQQIKEWCATD
jgi:pimeloyl-ACP methyl ester carboxylesterase